MILYFFCLSTYLHTKVHQILTSAKVMVSRVSLSLVRKKVTLLEWYPLSMGNDVDLKNHVRPSANDHHGCDFMTHTQQLIV